MPKAPKLKTFAKSCAIAAVVGALGLGLGTLALRRYLTPERVRELIATQARKSLQREVSLGRISVGLVQGLVVEKFAISERPDFSAGRFAEADSFSVRLSLLPLLHKQLAVDKVTAEGLKLTVIRRPDGKFNFSDFSQSSAPAAGAAPVQAAVPPALLVSNAELRNASITYKDAAAGQAWDLAIAGAKVSDFRLDGPFNADLELRARGSYCGKPVDAALAFSGKVDLGAGKPERMSAVIRRLKLVESGRELRLSGKLANLTAPRLDLSAQASLSGSDLAEVQAKGVITSTGPRPAADLLLTLRTPGFDPQNPALLALLRLPLPKDLLVPETSLEGHFQLAGDGLAFDTLKVKTKLGTIASEGRVAKLYSGQPEPDLKADLHVDVPQTKSVPGLKLPAGVVIPQGTVDAKLRLKPWEATFDSLRIKTALATVDASGTVTDLKAALPKPRGLKAKVHLDLPRTKPDAAPWLKLPPGLILPAAKVDADLTLQDWDLTLRSLRVAAEGGSLEASGAVRDLLGQPQPQGLKVKTHLELPRLRSADVPFAKLPAELVIPACVVDADLDLQGWDAEVTSLRLRAGASTVEASGAVRNLRGQPKPERLKAKLHLDWPQMQAADVPLLKLPAGLSIPAAVADASLRFEAGDLAVDALHLKTKAGEADLKGTVRKALSQPQPDLSVQAKLDLPAFKSSDLPFSQVPPGLAVPATHLEVSGSGGLDSVNISRLRAVMGQNDLEVSGTVKAWGAADPALDLLLKCRSFALGEITPIAPQTRELKLAGSGFFAVSLSGALSKFLLSGKMRFKDLGATIAELPLSEFTGTASFDERRIGIPNLSGKVADGSLRMDLTVKDYRSQPAVDLEASLDRFNLGKYLAAKAAVVSAAQQRQAQKEAKSGEAPKAKAATTINAKGRFTIGELRHPNILAKDVKLDWDLEGLTPDLKSLGGTAKFAVAGGNFNNIGRLATQSVIVKVLVSPLLVIQKIGAIGGARIFPDFNNITFTEIAGDYAFEKGLMTLKDTHIFSDAAQVESSGTIDLPTEKLGLTVTAQVANVAPLDIKVTGTLDKPKTSMQLGKFLAAPIKQLFQKSEPAEQTAAPVAP